MQIIELVRLALLEGPRLFVDWPVVRKIQWFFFRGFAEGFPKASLDLFLM